MTLAKEVEKEGHMGILLIKCTHTGRSISTGLEVDPGPTRNHLGQGEIRPVG